MEGADLSRDEKLAIEIEKYPVIYDKGHPEHKRIDIQENATVNILAELPCFFEKQGRNKLDPPKNSPFCCTF